MLSDDLYDTDHLLQFLYIYSGTGAVLYDLRDRHIFPGSDTDHFHRAAGRHVGDADPLEHGCAGGQTANLEYYHKNKSTGIYCKWIQERAL